MCLAGFLCPAVQAVQMTQDGKELWARFVRSVTLMAGERLRVPTALSGDPSSVPSIHPGQHILPVIPASGDLSL